MKKIVLVLGLLFLSLEFTWSQQGVSINTNGNDPDSSAILDINVDNLSPKKGVLFPRMTIAERDSIPNPAVGLLIYNTDCNVFQYFDGTVWETIITDVNNISSASIGGITHIPHGALPDTLQYWITNPNSSYNYQWIVPSGMSIISGANADTVTVVINTSFSSGNICVTASTQCLSSQACLWIDTNYTFNNRVEFQYVSNATQTWVVPNNVHFIKTKCWGAGGGKGGYDSSDPGAYGGGGGYAESIVCVNPGDTLILYVAQGGSEGPGGVSGSSYHGQGGWGFGAGGQGGAPGPTGSSGAGGGGGGSSAVINTTTNTIFCVAAGGGGGGGNGHDTPGRGGSSNQNGENGSNSNAIGGTAASNSDANGTAGENRSDDGGGAGGGGGGYLHGGAGGNVATCDCGAGGGGGGDSFGDIIINGNYEIPGNASDSDRCSECAVGGGAGSSNNGGNGIIVIYY